MLPYYNYAYLDPSSPAKTETEKICFLFNPLYIGKGKHKRCFHAAIALEEGKQILTNKLLYVDLKRLLRKGFEPVILKFNEDTSNEDALSVESAIIELLGRRGIENNGILCNRALGGEIPDTSGLPSALRGKKMKDHLSSEDYKIYLEKMSRPKKTGAIKKMVQKRTENGSYKSGAEHQRARTFIIISPAGVSTKVVGGLKAFCETNNLSWQTLFNNRGNGIIKVDRSKYKNTARLSERFWNTVGWECR